VHGLRCPILGTFFARKGLIYSLKTAKHWNALSAHKFYPYSSKAETTKNGARIRLCPVRTAKPAQPTALPAGYPIHSDNPPRPSVSMGTQWCSSRALSIPGSKPACYQATGEGAMARLRCHHTKTKSGRSGTPMACLTRSPTIQPTVVHETTIPRVAYSHLPSVSASGSSGN
jgi:hypothetical protein